MHCSVKLSAYQTIPRLKRNLCHLCFDSVISSTSESVIIHNAFIQKFLVCQNQCSSITSMTEFSVNKLHHMNLEMSLKKKKVALGEALSF